MIGPGNHDCNRAHWTAGRQRRIRRRSDHVAGDGNADCRDSSPAPGSTRRLPRSRSGAGATPAQATQPLLQWNEAADIFPLTSDTHGGSARACYHLLVGAKPRRLSFLRTIRGWPVSRASLSWCVAFACRRGALATISTSATIARSQGAPLGRLVTGEEDSRGLATVRSARGRADRGDGSISNRMDCA